MIVGDILIFDLRQQTIKQIDSVVLEIDSAEGCVAVCKWEQSANKHQVADALERFVAELRDAKF